MNYGYETKQSVVYDGFSRSFFLFGRSTIAVIHSFVHISIRRRKKLVVMFVRSWFLFAFIGLLCLFSVNVALAEKKKGDMNTYLKRTGAKFIEETAKKEGVVTLKSGMLVEILKSSDKADAKSPTKSDACKVTYKGELKDGSQFDAGTTSFAPNQVISGWTEAMQLMGEGDHWRLYIPYNLAYGERGSPPRIPPYSPLVFELEIHEVKGGKGKPIAEARKMFEEAKAAKEEEL
jgi:hypothetical protein